VIKPEADSTTIASHDTTAPEDTLGLLDADTEQTYGPSTGNADEPVADEADEVQSDESGAVRRRVNWSRVLAFGVLPALALILAVAAGFLRWEDATARDAAAARIESVQAAKDSTIALLSYKADTAEQQLGAARDLLTGDFRDSYSSLINDVVIPGAKQKKISTVATVPAAASLSASPDRASVLVFINQSVIVGDDAPTDTASSVKVTLDNVGGHWLISGFDPV
jgi:Mce-associated membrane protein